MRRTTSARFAAMTVVLIQLVGCTHWAPVPLSEIQAPSAGAELRLTTIEGDTTVVRSGSVRGDSIWGCIDPCEQPGAEILPVIPLSGVASVERREVDAGRTTIAAIAVPLGAGVVILGFFALACASGTCSGS